MKKICTGKCISQIKCQNLIRIMKITFTLFLLFTSGLFASEVNSQMARVNISVKNVNTRTVLNEIERQTDYLFIFSPEDINMERATSISAENQPVAQVLSSLFRETDISYAMEGYNIFLLKEDEINAGKTGLTQLSQSDKITIRGLVIDESGEPVIGANVVEKGTTNGVTTDMEGSFILNIVQNSIVQISYIGYIPQEVAVRNQSNITIVLIEDTKVLDEIVIIGYGSVRKSDLTGSVSSISSDKVTQVKSVSNIAQTLQGQMSGVMANQRSGQPGEAINIIIRGANSISGGNDPLYVVDGMLLESLSSQLNPDDIQNIEILKDASATAIYGSRGANGVIMITTKRGSEGKPQVSYSGYFGGQTLRKKLDLIDAHDFAILQNEVAANDGTALPWTDSAINALGKGTDWQDEVYRTGAVQNHDISLKGGSTNTKYYTSFGYFSQDGIIRNSGFDRISFRVNFDQTITSKIDLSTSLSIQNSKYKQAVYTGADGGGGIPFTTMVMPSTQGIYNEDGTYTRFTGVSWGETNPVGISKEVYNPTNSTRVIGNGRLNIEIIDGLTLRLSAGIDQENSRTDYYAPSTITLGQTSQGNGRAYKNYSNKITFLNENILSYNKTFENHTFDAMAGYTYQYYKYENLNSGTATGFISDIYQNNNIGAAEIKAQPSSGFNDNTLVSYLGRINYNYLNKYYITLTGRYDGSSKFGENNKYAFFPSGALAWRVSEEEFIQDVDAISNLKLRLSYGTSGNQAISSYQTLSRLNNVNLFFDGKNNTGFVQQSLENKDLKWESTSQFDIGFDLNFLNDRIQLTADYYYKKTTDLLLPVRLPPSSGFSSVIRNVGSIGNRGWEAQISTLNFDKDFKWNTVLTLSQNKTEVLDLGNDVDGNPITYLESGTGGNWFPIIVGESMRQLYGQTVVGVYQTDDEAIQNGEPTKKAGDYKFKNFDGQGNVDDSDKRIISHLEPKLIFGLNNTFAYKNIDLSILLVGTYGNDIANEFRKYNLTVNGNWTPTQEAFDNRWRGQGTSNKIDKPSANSASSIRDYANTLWVEDGSYIRVRDITLGYTFPKNMLKPISSLYVYISGQNLFTFTNYSGYDPEAVFNSNTAINGWDRGVYPSTKSVIGGIKVTF